MYQILLLNSVRKYSRIVLVVLLIHSLLADFGYIIAAEKLAKCDYQKYLKGCRNADTQECEQVNQLCRCRSQYPISLSNGICLERKSMGDGCMSSVQCDHIPNAGCYGLDTEFKDDFWVQLWHKFGLTDPGKCSCDTRRGFSFNKSLKACVKKMTIGSRCSGGWDCYSKVPNSICSTFDRCECRSGYYYDSDSDSCKIPLSYGDKCISNEGCISSLLICEKNVCKCKPGYHFDKYKSPKCQPNNDNGCPDNYKWSEKAGDCIDKNIGFIEKEYNINNLNDFDLIEPPRIYSIFVILALWICLLFILGNAKRGIRLVEKAVRRDQASQYRQCDTCTVESTTETEHEEVAASQVSLHSSMSSVINQCIPPPTFDELYPNSSEQYSDDPPTYEQVIMLDKEKDLIV